MTIDKQIGDWRYTVSPIDMGGKIEYQYIILTIKDKSQNLWETVNIDICETEREAEDTVKTLLELAGIL
jgi:hypothetical protein